MTIVYSRQGCSLTFHFNFFFIGSIVFIVCLSYKQKKNERFHQTKNLIILNSVYQKLVKKEQKKKDESIQSSF